MKIPDSWEYGVVKDYKDLEITDKYKNTNKLNIFSIEGKASDPSPAVVVVVNGFNKDKDLYIRGWNHFTLKPNECVVINKTIYGYVTVLGVDYYITEAFYTKDLVIN